MKTLYFRINIVLTIFLLIGMVRDLPVVAQTKTDGSSPQFLYPDFTNGKVRMKNGKFQILILNYNTVSEKMVFMRDEKIYDMTNPEMIDTVFLEESSFVPFDKVFYRVILNAPVSFFVQYKGEIMSPGTPAGYGVNSQVSNTKNLSSVELASGHYNLKLPTDYTVKTDFLYWIRKDGNMSGFANERQFMKLFPDHETELKQFLKQNKIKFDKVPDVMKLAEYYNKLIL